MVRLFISYRRNEDAGFAGRLTDALEAAFGTDAVFRDIDDIRPGEDFVDALNTQLERVDLIVVLIGPSWMRPSQDGVRRLDRSDDFVRMEIATGIAAGKALLPVLVAGAPMPREDDLPPAIKALARHQAFTLSDAGWASDIARMVAAIKAIVPLRRRLRWQPIGKAAAVLAIAGLLAFALDLQRGDATSTQRKSVEAAQNLAGRWTSRVRYDWGAVHEETLVLRVSNGEVHGSVSYLGVARTVEQGKLAGDRLSFITRSQETLGNAPSREVTHRYSGTVRPGQLDLLLESGGGYSAHTPVDLLARRAP